MKQCGQCRKMIDTQARTCPYCQTRFTDEELKKATKLARVRSAVFFAIVLGGAVLLIKSCGI